MELLTTSGLPIGLEPDGTLIFSEGLSCAGGGEKYAEQMLGLLCSPESATPGELCYRFYRDIVFEKDRTLFESRDFRYDITVVLPGCIGGERKKTSGHYHGYIAGKGLPYPEVYEVLRGQACFLMQRALNFDQEEAPRIEDLKAVFVEAGQAVIIPPFYGHCSINAGDGPLVFSNIAVVACPMHYEPMQRRHGLAAYAVERGGSLEFAPNPHYENMPEIKRATPHEAPELGIRFGSPVYGEFVQNPEIFEFLLNPEPYLGTISSLLR